MSAVTAVRTRALALPVWAWLSLIVGISIAVRIALAGRMVAPWIMIDELVYSELAKNVAAHGRFLVRGVPSTGYGFVYPALIAPAWRLFGPIPDVYTAAKTINSVLMSLAAIPTYFLARRVLPPALSLLAATLAVAIPSMLYTGMLMTENAFYPVFLLASLLLVLTLERPTWRRQLALLFVSWLAFETRAQAVALIPAIVAAPIVLALVERRALSSCLRQFRVLYGILGGGIVLALAATAARGQSPLTLLGAYRAATSSSYTVSGVLHFFLYHAAGLDLSVGVIPLAALLAMWLSPRSATGPGRAFVVASLTITLCLVAEVAVFASASFVNRIEERNLFYVTPFALIALLGLVPTREGSGGLVTARRRPLLIAAAIAGVLPFFIPYTRLISTSATSDTFSLLPWWWVQDHWITIQQVRWAALGTALVAGALFVVLPRRYALLLPALVAVYFIGTSFIVENGRHGIYKTTAGDAWAGTHALHPDWVDRKVGRSSSVSFLWTTSLASAYPLWEDEFFNRSVHTVYDVDGAQEPDPLPETPVTRAGDGRLLAAGRAVTAQYVLTAGAVEVAGTVIAHDKVGVDLYRVNGPIVVLSHVRGLYKDTWAGRTATYQRVECTGGRLTVTLLADSQLFPAGQTVTATESGKQVGRSRIPFNKQSTLTVPLHPQANGRCVVTFTAAHTRVPARVFPGSDDTRALGAHYLSFTYHP